MNQICPSSNDTQVAKGGHTVREDDLPVVRPHYQVDQSEDAYEVAVILPGVRREDVALRLEEGILRVDARRTVTTPDGWRPLRSEMEAVRYRLDLRVEAPVDGDAIGAKLEDGVLKLHLPLRADAQPRSIAVS